MEKRFKGTQKPQEVIPYLKTLVGSINEDGVSGDFGSQVFTPIEQEAHAELWHDAITTIQKCDLMPSELKTQRDELLEVVEKLIEPKLTQKESITHFNKWREIAQELINKIK